MSGAFVGHDVFTCRMCSMTHICWCDMNTGLLRGHVNCNHIRECAVTHLHMYIYMTWPIHVRAITYTHHYRTNHTLTHTHTHTHTRLLSSLTQIHTNAPLQHGHASCWDNCRRITPDKSLWTRILATARCSSPHKQPYIPAKEPPIPAKDPVLYSIKREIYKHVTTSALARTNSPALLQKCPAFQQKRTVFQQ